MIDQKEIAECYQPLFNLLHEEHGLILLASEMNEVIEAAEKVKENFNKLIKP